MFRLLITPTTAFHSARLAAKRFAMSLHATQPNAVLLRRCSEVLLACLALLTAPAWGSYTAYANGTVYDNDNGLRWDQCAYGLSGANCGTGTAVQLSWQNALQKVQEANAANYKGISNWRLPNVKELESLIDLSVPSGSRINATYFPATPNSFTWSSTPFAGNAAEAWYVSFFSGGIGHTSNTTTAILRLVTDGQQFAPFDLLATSPTLSSLSFADTTLDSTTLKATSSASGRIWYMLVPAGSAAPTKAQIKSMPASYGSVTPITSGNTTTIAGNVSDLFFSGLTAGTSYDAYLFAEDQNPLESALIGPLTVTTLADVTPPVSTGPVISDVTSHGVTTHTTLDESGYVYVYIKPASGTPPTVDEMKNFGFPIAATATVPLEVKYDNLTPNTAFVLYILAKDKATPPNFQAAVSASPSFTTLAGPPGTSATGTAPGASGPVSANFYSPSSTCTFATTQFPSAQSVAPLPPGVAFPHGAFGFTTTDCGPGASMTFTMTYPNPLPPGTKYYKYNGTNWVVHPAMISGNQITFTITDNGPGDTNPTPGFITDPGGPGVPAEVVVPPSANPQMVPTLGEYALLLLMALMGGLGWHSLRLRREG